MEIDLKLTAIIAIFVGFVLFTYFVFSIFYNDEVLKCEKLGGTYFKVYGGGNCVIK